MAIFVNYAIRRCKGGQTGFIRCPYCLGNFDVPFRPDGVYVIDVRRVHRSNAQRCGHCGKFFAVHVADWAAAGYPA
jgi:hypothetical protein